LNTERIQELAQQHLLVEQMKILVVGDKAVIGESLAELGYPIIEMDEEGNPLN
jgi:hypothetical protein